MNQTAYTHGFQAGFAKVASLRNVKKILQLIEGNPAAKERIFKQLGMYNSQFTTPVSYLHQRLKSFRAPGVPLLQNWRAEKRIANMKDTGRIDPGFIKAPGKNRAFSPAFRRADTDSTVSYRGLNTMLQESKNIKNFDLDRSRRHEFYTVSPSWASLIPHSVLPREKALIVAIDRKKLSPELRGEFSRSGPSDSVDRVTGKFTGNKRDRFLQEYAQLKPELPIDHAKAWERGMNQPRTEHVLHAPLSAIPEEAIKYYESARKGYGYLWKPIQPKPPVDPAQQALLQRRI